MIRLKFTIIGATVKCSQQSDQEKAYRSVTLPSPVNNPFGRDVSKLFGMYLEVLHID